MKKLNVIPFLIFYSVIANAQYTPRQGADKEKIVDLPISVFQNQKGQSDSIVFRTGIPLNDDDARRIIVAAYSSGFADSIKKNSHSAIIIIQHQLNPKKLNGKTEAKKSELCSHYNNLITDTAAINLCHQNLDCVKGCKVPSQEQLDFLLYLEARRDSDIAKMTAVQAEYELSGGGFVELDPIVNYIYHFDEQEKHSDYLLNVDDIYVILIGGKTDLAASSISTKRTANRNESDFVAAGKLATSLFSGDPELIFKQEPPALPAMQTESATFPLNTFQFQHLMQDTAIGLDLCDSIIERYTLMIDSLTNLLHPQIDCILANKYEIPILKATLLHISPKELYLPGELTITPLGKTGTTFNLHARQWVGVQVGMLGSPLALRNYTLQNDTLNVSIPFEKTKWDVLPFMFVQIYPGRDIDRLSPIRLHRVFDKKKWLLKSGNFVRNRFSIYGGIRISKQPIQTFSFGFSFALGPNVNIQAGWIWNRTLDVVNDYYLGHLQDEKRLDEFAKTSYVQTFGFGISVSPGIYKDWFGSNK
jgi:hypothetical protein